MSHTPGPWTTSGDLIIGGQYEPRNPKATAHAYEIAKMAYSERDYQWVPDAATQSLNARLIAAAPDLLAAIYEIMDVVKYGEDPKDIVDDVTTLCTQAIAKATGGAQ